MSKNPYMRLPILNKLCGRIELHSLFLQPTYWCAKDCEGCYVKERDPLLGDNNDLSDWGILKKSRQTPLKAQFELIKLFCTGEDYWANEITIAMDDIPSRTGQIVDELKREHMLGLSDSIFDMIREYKIENKVLPKMHMTFNSIKTYWNYLVQGNFGIKQQDNLSIADLMSCEKLYDVVARPACLLDMINFSHLNPNKITKRFLEEIRKRTHVNYNYLIPRYVNQLNIKRHVDHLTKIGEMVDSIYLVIFKAPVGRSLTLEAKEKAKKNMANDLYYIREVKKRLPKDIVKKINIDGCLKDVEKFHKTGYGCSGNISKMQIWPDGKVTGCAYKSDNPTYQKCKASTAEELIWNIKNAKGLYDFNDGVGCYLPEAHENSKEYIDKIDYNRFKNITKEIL